MLSNKRYTVLPRQSIDYWSEGVGVSKLPEDVADILAEDVTYRLREVVHSALEFMKHSKRTCLTVDDLNFAFNEINSETIYGHGGPDVVTYKSIPINDQQISYIDEKDVNLRDISLDNHIPEPTNDITLKASWSVVEGKHITTPNTPSVIRDKQTINEKNALKEYLELLLKSIHEESDDNLKLFYRDMCTNKNIRPILPRLFYYFSDQVTGSSRKESGHFMSTFCSLVSALLDNETIFFPLYLSQVMSILQNSILRCNIPVNDWSVIDRVAFLLARLSRPSFDVTNEHFTGLMNFFSNLLITPDSLAVQVYGAIVGLYAMGVETLKSFYPSILQRLNDLMENNTNDLKMIHISHAVRKCLILLLKENRNDSELCRTFAYILNTSYEEGLYDVAIETEKLFRGCLDETGLSNTSSQKVRESTNTEIEFSSIAEKNVNKNSPLKSISKSVQNVLSPGNENRKSLLSIKLNKRKLPNSHFLFDADYDGGNFLTKKRKLTSVSNNTKRYYRTTRYTDTRQTNEMRSNTLNEILVLFL